MDSNDDFYGKELNLNCFYMHTNFGQKYLKKAIVMVQENALCIKRVKVSLIAYLGNRLSEESQGKQGKPY